MIPHPATPLVTAAAPTLAAFGEWLNPENILIRLGSLALVGVVFIIFAECGLLIGFFLPGDSLLFITGMFVARELITQPVWVVVTLLCAAAVAGNLLGYWIGRKIGPALFHKPDSRFFKQEYVTKTHNFFERYGSPAIVLGRFVPIVRTFITAIAGIADMSFRRYAGFSAIGGVLWAGGVTLIGYFLGTVPFIHDNLELMLILIVLISVVPILIEYARHRRQARAVIAVAGSAGYPASPMSDNSNAAK